METLLYALPDEKESTLDGLKAKLEEFFFLKKKLEIVLICETKPSSSFLHRVLELFFDYRTALLKEIRYPKQPGITILHEHFHNGQKWAIDTPTILIGDIHEAACVHLSEMLYVTGKVEGDIYMDSKKACLFAGIYNHARLYFPHGIMRVVDGENQLWNEKEGGEKSWRELSL